MRLYISVTFTFSLGGVLLYVQFEVLKLAPWEQLNCCGELDRHVPWTAPLLNEKMLRSAVKFSKNSVYGVMCIIFRHRGPVCVCLLQMAIYSPQPKVASTVSLDMEFCVCRDMRVPLR